MIFNYLVDESSFDLFFKTIMKRRNERPPKELKVPKQRIQEMDIAIPKLEYKVVAQPILKTEFTGHVTVIPTVLIFYLNNQEFKVVATIIQETMENGACTLTAKQISIRNSISMPTIYTVIHNLRKMGIIYEKREGWNVKRAIDFNAVQHLNDLVSVEDRGIYKRLRGKVHQKNINNLTEKDLQKAYDQYVLPVEHDPEEEEEYD